MKNETPTQRRARIIEEARQELEALSNISRSLNWQRAPLKVLIEQSEKGINDEQFNKEGAELYAVTIKHRAEMVRQVTALLSLIDKFDNSQS